MSPFEMDSGWNPKSPLDILTSREDKNATLEEIKSSLKASVEDALNAYKISKAGQSARSSTKYKPHIYNVGDKLWLSKSLFRDAYAKSQESQKLSSRRFGPFTITRLIGNNPVELDLPDHVKIQKVVNISHTVPYHNEPNDIMQPVQPRSEPDE